MRYINHAKIDRVAWDTVITQADNGLIYALSWYLDIVAPGWDALVKEEDGKYVAVMPLPVHRKYGLRYLKQPVFAQQFGLFYVSTAAPTVADWQQIGSLLRRNFWFITAYSFNTANSELLTNNELGIAGDVSQTYCLKLQQPYTELQRGYNQNRRRQLAHAHQQNLHLEPTDDIELLIKLFAENTADKIHGLLGETFEYPRMRALYKAANQAGMASLWQARSPDGEVVAMVLLWHFNKQLTYIFNCSTKVGKAQGAITLLLDSIFRTHVTQADYFDFEAPPVPNLQQFYGSFGSVATSFLTITYNRLPRPLQQLNAMRIALQRRLAARR